MSKNLQIIMDNTSHFRIATNDSVCLLFYTKTCVTAGDAKIEGDKIEVFKY